VVLEDSYRRRGRLDRSPHRSSRKECGTKRYGASFWRGTIKRAGTREAGELEEERSWDKGASLFLGKKSYVTGDGGPRKRKGGKTEARVARHWLGGKY